ncbi:MAG: trypsin-like peptidase domain-containing protein [Planctomycetes bacterium]|nr:trypsin-like peptidase domain-containing protein [Planctomycetota bacterium]
MARPAFLAFPVALLAAIALAHATAGDEAVAPPIIDDRAIRGAIEAALIRFDAEPDRVTAEVLHAQLGRARCRLDLPPAPGAAAERDAAALYASAREAVVVVGRRHLCPRCPNLHTGTASGFFVERSGIVATNYHVVAAEAPGGFAVLTSSGDAFPVLEVLAASKADDTALLRVDTGGREVPCLPLRTGIGAGADVWAIGHPDGNFFLFTEGMVSRRFMAEERGGARAPRLAITADYARGSSGGPILDATGAAVAMVSLTRSIYYEERNDVQRNLQMVMHTCIPSEAILSLVEPCSAAAPGTPCEDPPPAAPPAESPPPPDVR